MNFIASNQLFLDDGGLALPPTFRANAGMARTAKLKRWLCLATFGLISTLATPAIALCPFHVGPSGAPTGTSTTDGLLFLRFSQGFVGPEAVVGAAPTGATAPDVLAFIQKNGAALDVDGDLFITEFDMMVITRYLFGFRSDALVAALDTQANAARIGGAAVQAFIDGGCVAPSADPRINVWNAMNAKLALGTPAGIEAAKQYMTPTAVENYGTALLLIASNLFPLIASYSPLVPMSAEGDYAHYLVGVPVPGSLNGEYQVHVITFLKMDDGSWRVDTM